MYSKLLCDERDLGKVMKVKIESIKGLMVVYLKKYSVCQ